VSPNLFTVSLAGQVITLYGLTYAVMAPIVVAKRLGRASRSLLWRLRSSWLVT
jgi:predicted MFS family arabinose efflux permease